MPDIEFFRYGDLTMIRHLFLSLVASLALAAGIALHSEPAVQIPYDRLADRIVTALQVSKGERVLLRYDPNTLGPLEPVLREKLTAKGAVVTFAPSGFPDLPGLLGYVEKLKGAAKLRPDSKLVIGREWPTGEARLQGALQISRGLMRVLAASEKKELEPA